MLAFSVFILGAFAKLLEATLSFVCLSVCPTAVCMDQLGSLWTDFREILYLSIFRKSVEKIHVSFKTDKQNGTLHEDIFDRISLRTSENEKCYRQ